MPGRSTLQLTLSYRSSPITEVILGGVASCQEVAT